MTQPLTVEDVCREFEEAIIRHANGNIRGFKGDPVSFIRTSLQSLLLAKKSEILNELTGAPVNPKERIDVLKARRDAIDQAITILMR